VNLARLRQLETRLSDRLDWAAAGLLLAALVLRMRLAAESYLNPDEAWVSLLAVPGSIGELYAQAARTAHPPLLVFLVHAVKRVSDAELALRIVPAVAGVLFPWLVYRWLGLIWSRTSGFLALALLAFSPALAALSAQVRGYTLLLAFVAAALYSLERALSEDSPAWMGAFAAALYLAVLTEYSAAMFVLPAALYVLWQGRARRLRGATWVVWVAGQAGAALIYLGLLFSQVLPRLERARTSGEYEIWLEPLFPRSGDHPLRVLAAGLLAQLGYLVVADWAPPACALLWPAGLVLVGRRARALLVLFGGPVLLMWMATLARLHPYGGSRHSVLLALSLAAGIAVAADRALSSRPALVALLALAFAFTAGSPSLARARLDMPAESQQKRHLEAALAFLGQRLPPDAVLLTDVETRQILGHYLAGREWLPETRHLPSEEQIGPMRVFAARWAYANVRELVADLELFRGRYYPPPGELVRVMDAGFTSTLSRVPEGELSKLWGGARLYRFGEGILVLEIRP
jgi:hypothetical protein